MKLFSLPKYLVQSSIGFSLIISPTAIAQVIPDNTLPNNSIVTPQGNVISIDGGSRAGENLFHSFEQFSILEGDTAFFNNASDIQNIFSRVTGGSISNINGIIKSNGTADLFLINPAGIIFGANASLDISGSFISSTADSIIFANGTEFSAVNPEVEPLLTIKMPLGLGFGEKPAPIINQSAFTIPGYKFPVGLKVSVGETLALIGGNISLEGGSLTVPGGRIELGSVSGNQTVSLNAVESGWQLGYENVQAFQDITLSDVAAIDNSGERGGAIHLQGKNINLTGDSGIFSFTFGEEIGQQITIVGTDSIEMSGVGTRIIIGSEETGTGGNLTIDTKQLIVKEGAQISTVTLGKGHAGDITIRATELIQLTGVNPTNNDPSSIATFTEGEGNSGNLSIETKQLLAQEGAEVSTTTFGMGNAGKLDVRASELIQLDGRSSDGKSASGLFAQVEREATGNGGILIMTTPKLMVLEGAQISTTARSEGKGGNIIINVSDSVLLSGTDPSGDAFSSSGIFVSAERGAGTLDLTTNELIVEKGAKISADNFGIGAGSNTTLNVNRLIIRDGGQIGAGSLLGQGATNNERGTGGELIVNAAESILITGTGRIGTTLVKSSLFTRAEGTGDAGNLNIVTPNLTVAEGGNIDVKSTGAGQAGNLTIDAQNITLDNGILSAETGTGDQGNITLEIAEDLTLQNDSNISARAVEDTNGGNITINTRFITAFPAQNQGNDIIANAGAGDGGEIKLTAQGIFGLEEGKAIDNNNNILSNSTNDIDASSNFGVDGTVTINQLDVNPAEGLEELPSDVVDVSRLVAQNLCKQNEGSEFILTGKGGVASSPSQTRSRDMIEINLVEPAPFPDNEQQQEVKKVQKLETINESIVEAHGWIINDRGNVELVAFETEIDGFPAQSKNARFCQK